MVALLLAWFWGLRTAHEGYLVASIAVDPLVGDALTLPPRLRDAMVQAISDNAHTVLPVGILQVIMGGLLLVVSLVTLFRGRVPLAFLLQVLAVNAAVSVLGHALGAPLRDAMIQVLTESPEVIGVDSAGLDQRTLRTIYRWAFHLGLGIDLVVFCGLGLSLTRPGARAFLAAPSRPHEEG